MAIDRCIPSHDVRLPVLNEHHDDRPDSDGEACELACGLSPAALRERAVLINQLLAGAHDRPSPIEGGVRARFVHSDRLERELRALVALEAECCAFLSLTVSRGDDLVVLDVTGPPEAQSLIDALFAPTRT